MYLIPIYVNDNNYQLRRFHKFHCTHLCYKHTFRQMWRQMWCKHCPLQLQSLPLLYRMNRWYFQWKLLQHTYRSLNYNSPVFQNRQLLHSTSTVMLKQECFVKINLFAHFIFIKLLIILYILNFKRTFAKATRVLAIMNKRRIRLTITNTHLIFTIRTMPKISAIYNGISFLGPYIKISLER